MSILDKNEGHRVPTVGDLAGGRGLGDMWSSLEERHQKYWDIYRPAHPVPADPAIAGGPPPPTPEQKMADALCEKLKKCCWIPVKKPAWIEPTITSIRLDRKTLTCVPLPSGDYMGGPGPITDILCIDIPDLCVGTIWGIGMLLEDDQDFDVVEWREERNSAVLIDGVYRFQKADPTRPSRDTEPVPIILPPLSRFCLRARNLNLGGPPKCATARIWGQILPVRDIAVDGSYNEYCTT